MANENGPNWLSLPKEQARPLITTHKTRPQMEGISSRNLLKVLPWVNVTGGFYRVNRRMVIEIRPGMVSFRPDDDGDPVIFGESLNQIPLLSTIESEETLNQIVEAAEKVEFNKDEHIVDSGSDASHFYIIAKGKVTFYEAGHFDAHHRITRKAPGDYFGAFGVTTDDPSYEYSAVATTGAILFRISYQQLTDILGEEHIDWYRSHLEEVATHQKDHAKKGESIIDLFKGLHHDPKNKDTGEPPIPSSYVAYDASPREYELSAVQTVLKIHTKVADLYNSPFNQTEEQLRLTIEELREAQEWEMINNDEFGLLHNVDFRQRLHTRSGPPTPDDMDELLSMRRKTKYFFAHRRAIAAFLRECSERGIYPDTVELNGQQVPAWRGCPLLTCNKIPVNNGFTSIIAMRIGEEDQGVVGLYQMGLPEEVEPSLSVRYMGIDTQAIISYLVTNYFSVAVLVPDALGVLEHVQVDHYDPSIHDHE